MVESRQSSPPLSLFDLEAFPGPGYMMVESSPCTGPLKKVFERGAIPGGLKVQIEGSNGISTAYYRRLLSFEPGNELLRIFFTGVNSARQVVLTVDPRRFEISKMVDVRKEPIPSCDYGETGLRRPPGPEAFNVEDVSAFLSGEGRQIRTRILRIIDRNPIREMPVFSRPVYNPKPVALPGGQEGMPVEPDWSLDQVKSFSEGALLAIIDELDLASDLPRRKDPSSFGIKIEPSLRPAKEIAALIAGHLQT